MRVSLGLKLTIVVGLLGLVGAGISAFALRQSAEEQARAVVTESFWNAGLQARRLAQAIDRLDETVPFTQRRDEIGEMAGAIAHFRHALIEKRDLDGAARERLAEDGARGARLAAATRAFEEETLRAVANLSGSAEVMRSAADRLRTTATDTTLRAE